MKRRPRCTWGHDPTKSIPAEVFAGTAGQEYALCTDCVPFYVRKRVVEGFDEVFIRPLSRPRTNFNEPWEPNLFEVGDIVRHKNRAAKGVVVVDVDDDGYFDVLWTDEDDQRLDTPYWSSAHRSVLVFDTTPTRV